MRPVFALRVLAALIVISISAVPSAQKGGKPKPPPTMPATAVFRCTGFTTTCGEPETAIADKITGDGFSYVGATNLEGTGSFLRWDGELVVQVVAGGTRRIYLDFSEQLALPSGLVWRKNFERAAIDAIGLNTNVIDPSTRDIAAQGARSIPVHSTWPTRIKGNFTGPDGVWYTLRFNPDGYPGSDYAWVTREAENVWTIEARQTDRVRLVSPDIKGGPRGPTDEGLYLMPFKVTISVP